MIFIKLIGSTIALLNASAKVMMSQESKHCSDFQKKTIVRYHPMIYQRKPFDTDTSTQIT